MLLFESKWFTLIGSDSFVKSRLGCRRAPSVVKLGNESRASGVYNFTTKLVGGSKTQMRRTTKTRETKSPTHSTEIYGVNPVLEILRAGDRPIRELMVADGVQDARVREIMDLARAQKIPIHRAPRRTLDRITGHAVHQGIVARVASARYADAEKLIESIALRVGRSPEPLVVILDGVEDPHNLGAVARTAECAGVDALFIPERRAAGLTDTVAKVSAGALSHLPVALVTNVSRLIDELKERNVWVVGTAADATTNYTDWDWTRASALVMGNEGSGLHRLVRERCDALVSVPVLGEIESLNVSVATGVILYEAVRQRRAPKT
jgi:23S rRNA (guanosine2251-2'-O)-methyltransferase